MSLLPAGATATAADAASNFLGLQALEQEIVALQGANPQLGPTYNLNTELAVRELGFDAQVRQFDRKNQAVTNPTQFIAQK